MKNLIIASDFSVESDLSIELGKVFKDSSINVEVAHLDELSDKLGKLKLSPDSVMTKMWGKDIPLYLVDDIKEQLERVGINESDLEYNVIKGKDFKNYFDYLSNFDEKETFLAVAIKPVDFWQRVLFGTFVEKLIFHVPHPVIIAKKALSEKPKKIAICFDPAQDSEKLLSTAENFAKKFGCQVDIIYVESFDSREIYKNVFATGGDSEKDKNQLMGYNRKLAENKFKEYKERFEKSGLECDVDIVLTVNSDPATDLKNHLAKKPVDFIFIEPHPGFRKSFRFNSTSYDLIKNVNENFVVVKEDQGE